MRVGARLVRRGSPGAAQGVRGRDYWTLPTTHESILGHLEALSQLANTPLLDHAELDRNIFQLARSDVRETRYVAAPLWSMMKEAAAVEPMPTLDRHLHNEIRQSSIQWARSELANAHPSVSLQQRYATAEFLTRLEPTKHPRGLHELDLLEPPGLEWDTRDTFETARNVLVRPDIIPDLGILGVCLGKVFESQINRSWVQLVREKCGIHMPHFYLKWSEHHGEVHSGPVNINKSGDNKEWQPLSLGHSFQAAAETLGTSKNFHEYGYKKFRKAVAPTSSTRNHGAHYRVNPFDARTAAEAVQYHNGLVGNGLFRDMMDLQSAIRGHTPELGG